MFSVRVCGFATVSSRGFAVRQEFFGFPDFVFLLIFFVIFFFDPLARMQHVLKYRTLEKLFFAVMQLFKTKCARA